MKFGLYVILKFAAYTGWCALGVHLFRGVVTISSSLRFGLLRLGIGIAFGVTLFFAGGMMHLNPPAHPFVLYIAVYAPVRVVEWLIVRVILSTPACQRARSTVATFS
jgi:hypothetical protein